MTICRSTLTPQAIFAKYIAPKIIKSPCTGCWTWTGKTRPSGHATVRLPIPEEGGGWKTFYVRRYIFETFKETPGEGMKLRNGCDNASCVNPDHATLETEADLRGRVGRLRRQSSCKRGHEYTPENTIVDGRGKRRCRKCHNLLTSGYEKRRREEDMRSFVEQISDLDVSDEGPRKFYVYHLVDPFTRTVFYVGKGCGDWALNHLRDIESGCGTGGNSAKDARIRSIISMGGEVEFRIVERGLAETGALWRKHLEIERIGIDDLTNKSNGCIPSRFRKLMKYGPRNGPDAAAVQD